MFMKIFIKLNLINFPNFPKVFHENFYNFFIKIFQRFLKISKKNLIFFIKIFQTFFCIFLISHEIFNKFSKVFPSPSKNFFYPLNTFSTNISTHFLFFFFIKLIFNFLLSKANKRKLFIALSIKNSPQSHKFSSFVLQLLKKIC